MKSKKSAYIAAVGVLVMIATAIVASPRNDLIKKAALDRQNRSAAESGRTGALSIQGRLVKLARTSDSQTAAAPTDSFCRSTLGFVCYSPFEIRRAYGLTDLIDNGNTGTGQTIIIIDSFGSPTIAADLHTFDVGYGLPDPPSFQVLAPLGTVPFNPSDPDQLTWAGEATADVEWAHAMAPGANIVLMTSPVDETQGVTGLPEFLKLEQFALKHHLGNIISQSWGTPENNLFDSTAGVQVLTDFEKFYAHAAEENVTVLAGTGDNGSSGLEMDGVTVYPMRVVNFPASSPRVTAVGGTSLYASTRGEHLTETVWNSLFGEGGGGVSQYFAEPLYQTNSLPRVDQTLLKGFRGLPDVSINADCNTAILIYESYIGAPGFYTFCGTSEGPPQWAGIVAVANQFAGHPLGFLNPRLYQLGHNGRLFSSMHDIIVSDNSVGFAVPGYFATPGWDPASGWGTPRAGKLIRALAEE
jgi:subtilase family serine protease